jgi:hypothetical protein
MGKIGTSPTDVERLCKRLQSTSSLVSIVYEAGPCGYGLYRRLVKYGFVSKQLWASGSLSVNAVLQGFVIPRAECARHHC